MRTVFKRFNFKESPSINPVVAGVALLKTEVLQENLVREGHFNDFKSLKRGYITPDAPLLAR